MGKHKEYFDKQNIEILKDVLETYLDQEFKKITVIDNYEFSDDFKTVINQIIGK